MTTSLILHARDSAGNGRPLPLVLTGHPSEIKGQKCYYERKEIIADGSWVHRGKREAFDITPSRTRSWEENYGKRLAAGIKTPILKRHTEDPTADDTLGYIIGLTREGDKEYADLQLIGDEALALAARNDVSIYEKAEGVDAKGNPFGLHLHHLALTCDPNQPNLGPFVTIAASAGGSAVDVPIYDPATAQQEIPMLKPETLTALRTKLPGLKPGATDADVAEAAALAALNPPADKSAEVTALSASVATLTSERDTARAEADTAKANVLALSANAPKTDPMLLTLMGDQFDARAEDAITAGAPKAFVETIGALLKTTEGKPNVLALSACKVPVGEGKVRDTLYGMAVMETVAKLYKGGFGQGVQPGIVNPASVLVLSGGGDNDKAPTPERMAELRQYAQIATPATK